jgi:hypothetical protein
MAACLTQCVVDDFLRSLMCCRHRGGRGLGLSVGEGGGRRGFIGQGRAGAGRGRVMKLKRFLLRYYPPGIILEYELR